MVLSRPLVSNLLTYVRPPLFDTFCAPSSSNLTVMEIVGRIEANQELFQRKYAKKMAAEDEYYKNRYKLTPKDASSA